MNDHEELLTLATKYGPLLRPSTEDIDDANRSVMSLSQSYDEHGLPIQRRGLLDPAIQAHLDDDVKADIMFLQQKTASVLLSDEAADISGELAKVAEALKLSRISYSNIVETLLDMQDIDRLSGRVSLLVQEDINKASLVSKLIDGHLDEVRSVLHCSKRSGAEPAPDDGMSSDQQLADLAATAKKVQKYKDESEKLQAELKRVGVFDLCPTETSNEFTSPRGMGPLPLPHAALKALADRIEIDNKKHRELQRDITTRFGFLPTSKEGVERAIESLRTECQQLEVQLNEAINGGS